MSLQALSPFRDGEIRVVDINNPKLRKYRDSESGDTVKKCLLVSKGFFDTLGLAPPSGVVIIVLHIMPHTCST
jgi:hypothetical protein